MNTATKLTPNDLNQFTGTENWYRHPFNRKVVYTDGMQYFVKEAGAYWLLDILATEVYDLHDKNYFLSIKFEVHERAGVLKVFNGDEKKIYTREIGFTDCPEGTWEFFQIHDGQYSTILVTSEY